MTAPVGAEAVAVVAVTRIMQVRTMMLMAKTPKPNQPKCRIGGIQARHRGVVLAIRRVALGADVERFVFDRRENFIQAHHDIGFYYWDLPSENGQPYWQEGVVYAFESSQIDHINQATNELYQMCLFMVDDIVQRGDYPCEFGLSELSKTHIERSWQAGERSLYGRFDLAYDGTTLKMLEFNGDTPTGLLEGSLAQWHYLHESATLPDAWRQQNNALHDTLVNHWRSLYPKDTLVHFTTSRRYGAEDWGNVVYLMNTALEAGLCVKDICLEDIGVRQGQFVDLQEQPIERIFKLYPWEWLMQDEFAKFLSTSQTTWLEPAYKMLLSNKAMLVALWRLFPNHPLLLEAHATPERLGGGKFCQKAILGREGQSIYVYQDGQASLAKGSLADARLSSLGSIYQKWIDLPNFDGFYPVIGSWVVGGQACGMSIREDPNVITGDNAHFACHCIKG